MRAQDFPGAELPRAASTISAEAQSFDGDPSSAAAPAVFRDMPIGATYEQPSNGLFWTKTSHGWQPQESLGFFNATRERLFFTVDPVNGISPPSGITVHTQAEYVALGAPLKYAQDALDILPQYVDYYTQINLLAGTHLAKPGGAGFSFLGNRWLTVSKSCSSRARDQAPLPGQFFTAFTSLWFKGADHNVLQMGVSGSRLSDYVINAPGQAWIVNEHRGRFVQVTDGANAGSKYLIVGNTASTLDITGFIYTAGAMTFNITAPSSIVLNSENGTTPLAYEMVSTSVASGLHGLFTVFADIQFGTVALGSSWFQLMNTSFVFPQYCRLVNADTAFNVNYGSPNEGGASVYMDSCDIELTSGYLDSSGFNVCRAQWLMFNNLIRGSTSRLMRLDSGVAFYGIDNWFLPSGTAEAVAFQGGQHLIQISDNGFRVRGSGTSTGIRVYSGDAQIRSFSAVVDNCSPAVDIAGGESFTIASGSITGTGNAVAWRVRNGSQVNVPLSSALAGTVEVEVDGVAKTYSGDFSTVGSVVNGALGSRVRRFA